MSGRELNDQYKGNTIVIEGINPSGEFAKSTYVYTEQ